MKYPQYRKLSNNKSFYVISNDRNFDEYQIIGTKVIKYSFKAEKYPEILRIKDMVDLSFPGVVVSTKAEIEDIKKAV